MRKACIDAVYELAKKDSRVFYIGSDLGVGTLKKFKEEMPERFFMEGVSEANIVGMAAGLAMCGKIPYIHTIATFFSRRAYEQIVLDLCLHNANVRLICNGGGLVYAPLGPTHEAIEDISLMRAIPNMTIVAPADANEMKKFMHKTIEYEGPVYIRLGKGGEPNVTKDNDFEIGKIYQMRQGKDAGIITTGITLKNSLEAAIELSKKGVEVSVIHVPTIKPLDNIALNEYITQVPVVATIEEHSVIGGLGSAVAEIIAEANFNPSKRFKRIGIPDVFPDQYGSQENLMKKYDITTEKLVSVIKDLMKK